MSDQAPAQKEDFYCCEYSRSIGEQLFGTAPRAKVWLALEYSAAWSADAFANSTLAESVKQYVTTCLNDIPASRLQLIRRQNTESEAPKSLFVALVRESDSVLYKFPFTAYEDLLTLDIAAIAAGDSAYDAFVAHELIYLVCVNGRRDRSCTKFGMPLYDAFRKSVGGAVWQTTHLGGHRFAGNVTVLPIGICYGWVIPSDVQSMIDHSRQNRLYLEKYRGRSCYSDVGQAAEYFLKTKLGERGLASFHLLDVQPVPPNAWTVQFTSIPDGKIYRAKIAQVTSAFGVYKNSTDSTAVHVPQFLLEGGNFNLLEIAQE